MTKLRALILTGMMLLGLGANASALRTIDADAIVSSDHTQTYNLAQFVNSGRYVQETPTGSCNGSNTTVTLGFTPSASSTVQLFQDGLALVQGSGKDYTISGATITLTTACVAGQILSAAYVK